MLGGRTRQAGPASSGDIPTGAACRPRAPSQGSPGVPRLASRGGAARLAAGGHGGHPPAQPTARGPQGSRGAAPGAARLSGDGVIRRYGGRRSQTGRILTRSLCLGRLSSAAGWLFAPAGTATVTPLAATSLQRATFRSVPMTPSRSRGSQPGWGASQWMLVGPGPRSSPTQGHPKSPWDAQRMAAGAGTAAVWGHPGDALGWGPER